VPDDHWNEPEAPDTDHDPDDFSDDAVNAPCEPAGPDTAATTAGEAASGVITPVSACAATSLDAPGIGVCTRHAAAVGVVSTHAGNCTR